MCVTLFQEIYKKKRVCVAGSLYILKVNNCNNVNHINEENYNKCGLKNGSYARVLQRKRCIKVKSS
jgi:hypothetical protein